MKKKKWQKFILIAAFVFGIMSASASAQVTEQDEVHVGDIFEIDGHMEQVFRVNKDGTYSTFILDGIESYKVTDCKHDSCVTYKIYSETEILGEKEKCYRVRNVKVEECEKCKKRDLKNYDTWKYAGHKYSVSTGICKLCGRKK